MGRDCCFSWVLCGLGVGDGTRLLLFWGYVWSRCSRRDETAAFPGFCAVSVLEKGRDCCFSGVLRGLGVGEGTRLSLPFQVRTVFGGRLAYRAFVREDGVAVLLLSSRRRSTAVVFEALGVAERDAGPSRRDSGREMQGAESLGVMNNRPGQKGGH